MNILIITITIGKVKLKGLTSVEYRNQALETALQKCPTLRGSTSNLGCFYLSAFPYCKIIISNVYIDQFTSLSSMRGFGSSIIAPELSVTSVEPFAMLS